SINTASKEISMKTCVDFYRRASEIDYVEFIKQGHSCVSNVGRVGGRQVVSLKGKCSDHGMLVHQMLHVIGMWHEQSRHDRDQYVTINIDNVDPENRFNFKKRGRGSTVGKYDKTSIMHLDGYVFSSNQQPTIVDKTSGYAVVAQRTKLTDLDVAKINQLYQC
uniref:Metalloendopeptidase n=1 Tax=Ciona savignyi TaxID=51511 RepID=H2ZFH0_CIOSA